MQQQLIQMALLVHDYDEAIAFYTQKLQFVLLEDTLLSETKRWVRIAPKGSEGACLLLAQAVTEEQKQAVGNQAGGRVFLFLHTDDFDRDYQNLQNQAIIIVRKPVTQPYGTVAVFADLYGNLWDLIGPSSLDYSVS